MWRLHLRMWKAICSVPSARGCPSSSNAQALNKASTPIILFQIHVLLSRRWAQPDCSKCGWQRGSPKCSGAHPRHGRPFSQIPHLNLAEDFRGILLSRWILHLMNQRLKFRGQERVLHFSLLQKLQAKPRAFAPEALRVCVIAASHPTPSEDAVGKTAILRIVKFQC